MNQNKGNEQDKNPTLTWTQQPSPAIQCKVWFTPRLPSHPGAPQGKGHQGEGHRGEDDRGDCLHLPICRAAPDPHPHPRCFRLPQLPAELSLLGEVFAPSQAPQTPAQRWDESPEYVVMGEAPGFRGCWAGAGGCGHGVCSRISWPCSCSPIGWSSAMVCTSSADILTISPWPIVQGSSPSSSSSCCSSSSSSSSSSFSSSSSSCSSSSSSLSPSCSISTSPSKSMPHGASTSSSMHISTSESGSESYLPSDSAVESVSSCEEIDTAGDASSSKYTHSS